MEMKLRGCQDCLHFDPENRMCAKEGIMTEEDRIKATQGRCPYFEECVVAVSIRWNPSEVTVDELCDLRQELEDIGAMLWDDFEIERGGMYVGEIEPAIARKLEAWIADRNVMYRVVVG